MLVLSYTTTVFSQGRVGAEASCVTVMFPGLIVDYQWNGQTNRQTRLIYDNEVQYLLYTCQLGSRFINLPFGQ